MHIIIVGGGGVGFELAYRLSKVNQDVVVIEKSSENVKKLEENLDVLVINDNGVSKKALEEAGVKNAKMLIAVTHNDEVNMLSCILGKNMGVSTTIARIRNEEYTENAALLPLDLMGIDFVINPERIAAQEISRLIHFPDASEVEYFAKGKVKMVGITIGKEAHITNQTLKEAPFPQGCIIVGIDRPGEDFLIPSGNDVVKPGDKIYILGNSAVLQNISWLLQHPRSKAYRVTILGGGNIACRVATLLESGQIPNFSVKIVEKNPERCQELSQLLSRTLVLCGDATDLSFFKTEEIDETDALVVVTGEDRTNVVAAVLAQQLGVKKIICEVKRQEYTSIYLKLGIDSLINPRLLAAGRILRFTRREDVIFLAILQNQNAEVMELFLPPTAKVVGKKISQAKFPRGMLIGAIVRNGEVIVPHGDTYLMGGDRLVVFTLPDVSSGLNRYFAGTKRIPEDRKKKPFDVQ